MGGIQIPFGVISSAGADLADPENDLVNYFLSIDTQRIAAVIASAFGTRGPKGYGVSLVLSRILKVKQLFVSDRILAQRLKEVATYRRLCGFSDGKVPAHNTYSTLRKALGVRGYAQIHAGFIRSAHSLNLLDPELPMLPKNRRKGLIVIADLTTIRAYCSTSGKKQPDGTWLFTDPSVTFGRPHHRDKFPIGHKAHSLMAITGVPLVSEISPRNAADQDYLFPLLDEFRKRFPEMNIAYIVLDRGYDAEPIHRKLYEDYDITPIIVRKKAAYPNGFAPDGIPLCIWGQRMSRTGIDYARKRTRYACKKVCQRAEQMTFDCPYLDNSFSNGQIRYTKFQDGYRKYGPAMPGSSIYQKLKPLRTAIERNYGLVKENRYRMETTNTYMGMDNVLMHVIEHDISLTLDIIFMFKRYGKISPLLNLNY
jgi:hypothetical protein